MKAKKVMAVSLALAMASSMAVSTSTTFGADENNNGSIYTSENGNYIAKKLTHTEQGTKTADGIVDYAGNSAVTDQITGVGDRAQSYSWSATGYGDYVYIGTCANAMTNTLTLMKSALGDNYDEDVMKAELNALFNGHFFVEEEDGGNPLGILLKLNVKTGEVKLLMSKSTTGTNCLFRNSVEYNGKLYFCGSVNGMPSIYEINPENDEIQCVYKSMTIEEQKQAYREGICVGIRGMCVYNGKLVVSLVGVNGAYICATDNPSDSDSFEVIADMDDLFNYPAYHYSDSIYGGSVWDMVEFNNSLYVVLCTGTPENKPDSITMQSFAMVRGDVNQNGEWEWTSLVGDKEEFNSKYTYGIDPERTRSGAANLAVYGDYLYIGEYNDAEIAIEDILFSKNCDFVNANLEQSVNLYRMDKMENIELVVGEADEMFPDGSLTGCESGFGRNENQYIWRMQVYNNKLYIGTFDTSSLLQPIGQFTNGDLLEMTDEEWESQINYITELIRLLKSKQETPSETIATSDVSNTLTKSQKKKVVSAVNSAGSVKTLSKNSADKAINISEQLEDLKSMLDEQMSTEFIEQYEELYNELQELYPSLPSIVEDEFEQLISSEMINTVKSFLTCGAYLSTAERGFDLYTLDENMNVETITTNGFGDPYNHGCRVFALTNEGMSIGTANPFYGTQVWSLNNISEAPTEPSEEVTVPTAPTEPSEEVTVPTAPTTPSEEVTVPTAPTEPSEEVTVPTAPTTSSERATVSTETPTTTTFATATPVAPTSKPTTVSTTPTTKATSATSATSATNATKATEKATTTTKSKVATGDSRSIIGLMALLVTSAGAYIFTRKKIKR
ncbi:MAG: hypothetical protein U0M12_06495 [Acutalibacteraceae bacterium]|nr:hypothetical protein [Acutalibacteraceae bacterium]